MPGPFGTHQLKIPYEPVADLLAKYAKRDPSKTAIVDLESGTAINFGQLDQVAIDIASYLKSLPAITHKNLDRIPPGGKLTGATIQFPPPPAWDVPPPPKQAAAK